MISTIIGFIIFFLMGSILLMFWAKKKGINKPFFYSFPIIFVILIIFVLMEYFVIFPFEWIISYFMSSIIGAFLISKFYELDFITSLRFSSWFIFSIFILFYFILLGAVFIIGWFLSPFILFL
jgi:hypothetical protein